MNDDGDEPINNTNAYFWVESPDGYYDDVDWNLVDSMMSDLTVWELTIDEAVEVAELFSNRRIDYDERSLALTIYGVPTDTWKWFEHWLTT